MKQLLFVLIVLLTLTPSVYPNSDVEQEIRKLEEMIQVATEKNDLATLNKLIDPNISYILGNPPRSLTREEMIQRSFSMLKNPNIGKTEFSNEKITVFGNTAIRTVDFKRKGKDENGKDFLLEGRTTRTWAKVDGAWKLVASHASHKVDIK